MYIKTKIIHIYSQHNIVWKYYTSFHIITHICKKKKIRHQAVSDFHDIENEQKNYLVKTTKYLVTLQNCSGFVICIITLLSS